MRSTRLAPLATLMLGLAAGPRAERSPAALACPRPLLDRLTLAAPGSTGGGWDQTARAMQRVLTENGLVRTVQVRNSPGGGGLVGLAQFVAGERGRGDALLVGGLVMVSAQRATGAAISLSDTAPLARLTGEYEVIAVPAACDLSSLAELVAALRVQPGAASWGGGSVGGADQLLVSALARAIGVDPVRMDYVPFSGGGETAEALLRHEISVGVGGYAEFAPHLAAGRLRALAISAPAPLPGLDIPTLREQGVDVTLVNWRGVFAPPGLTDAQHGRLADVVAHMVRTPGWRAELAQHRWTDLYLDGPAFARFVESETVRAASQPDPRGMTPAPRPGRVWTGEMRILRNRGLVMGGLAGALLLAVGLIIGQHRTASRREKELFQHLEAARHDASTRGAEAETLLRGLSEQIDRQFAEWGLTRAEREVALLMLKGLRHKEIACVRQTSERTVRQQAFTIYKKAGLDGRTNLAAFFLEDLLLPVSPPVPRRSA
jgi:putative tricarboxylic transport membrane protein